MSLYFKYKDSISYLCLFIYEVLLFLDENL